MWFKRKHNEYGCPMCGRLPKIIKGVTRAGVYLKSIYRLQCPENTSLHAGTATLMTQADSGNN